MLLGLLAPLCFFTSALLAANTPDARPFPYPLGPLISPAKPYNCLASPRVGVQTLSRPDSNDCAHALDQIMQADKAGAPILISRTEGYKVPHTLQAGNCAIFLNTSERVPNKPVTLALAAVVDMALVIMSHCIQQGPGLGGSTFLGSWDDSGGVLDVLVFGRPESHGEVSITPMDRVEAALARSGVGSRRLSPA